MISYKKAKRKTIKAAKRIEKEKKRRYFKDLKCATRFIDTEISEAVKSGDSCIVLYNPQSNMEYKDKDMHRTVRLQALIEVIENYKNSGYKILIQYLVKNKYYTVYDVDLKHPLNEIENLYELRINWEGKYNEKKSSSSSS